MAKLAIKGGPKTVTRTLGKSWPIFDEREEQALLEVCRSGKWWRGGYQEPGESRVGHFENAFGQYQHARHCVAVTNGTQALECALKAAGVEPGQEVLVPALTFVASATAISLVGAKPVFVDVDPANYNIDPEAMDAAITPDTSAAVVVHNGGYPCDMDRVLEVAGRRGIRIIEDCAHAHGSEWDGRRVGAIGDLGGFSFQMGKTLTCGEGGAVTTNDDDLGEKAFSFHHIGRIKGRPFYEFHRVASNLRMTEWQGAVLLCQLARLDEQTETRERNTKHLAEGLRDIPGVDAIERDPRVTRWGFYYWNLFFNPDEFEGLPKAKFKAALAAEGLPIGDGGHGQPIYNNPVFQQMDLGSPCCPVAEDLHANRSLSITHRAFLGDTEDMDLMLAAIRKVRENVGEIPRD